MPIQTPALAQITLAATRVEEVTDFYNAVFGAKLEPDVEAYADDITFYRGTLAGIPLLVVPNEVAGVVAEQSRHQLHLAVGDLDAALVAAQEMGGKVDEEVTAGDEGAPRTVVVRDPDGNTLVLRHTSS